MRRRPDAGIVSRTTIWFALLQTPVRGAIRCDNEHHLLQQKHAQTHMHNSVVPGLVGPRVHLIVIVEQHDGKRLKVHEAAHNFSNSVLLLYSNSQAQEELLRLRLVFFRVATALAERDASS